MSGAAARKLPFRVVFATSEEEGHPASELNHHGPTTRGWVSSNFCEYPQEIGIQFDEGLVSICQIQLLSHQYLIATKIELFAGVGDSYDTASFKRLGYLSLDSNQRSGYRARELKSVYVDAAGSFLKFRVHRCYLNNQNHTNQVSIVAISVLGDVAGEGAAVPMHMARAPAPAHRRAPHGGSADLAIDVGMDSETAAKLREVSRLKNEAVAAEDYEMAKQYKEVETRIRAAASQLARLHAEKQAAVAGEDYDLAKRLKAEIMRVRRAVMGVDEGPPARVHYDDRPPPQMAAGGPGMSRGHSHGGHSHRSHGGGADGGFGGGGGEEHKMGPGGGHSPQHSPHHRSMGRPPLGPGTEGGGGFPGDAAYAAGPGSPPRSQFGGPPMQQNDVADEMERPLPGDRSRNIYEDAAAMGDDPARPQSRAIKPAAADAAARAIDNEDAALGFGGATAARARGVGDPSQLAGVEGADTMPAPDELAESKVAEMSELVEVFGEYVVRCFFTKKPWTLRDAALQKVQLELHNYQNPPAKVGAAALKLLHLAATKDKIAQVFLTAILLVKPVVALCADVRKGEFLAMLEPLAVALVDKLGDNNARCREATFQTLMNLAHENLVGAAFVSSIALRKLKKKQAAAWRPLLTRLQLLHNIVELLGLGRASGLTADNLVRFLVDTKACTHSNGDVREAAKELCVAVYKTEGDSLMGRLGHLRKKQTEEYRAAFAAAVGAAPPNAGAGAGGGAADAGAGRRGGGRGGRRGGGRGGRGGRGGGRGGRRNDGSPDKRRGGGGGGGGGGGKRSPAQAAAAGAPGQAEGDEPEETECQFCGWPFPEGLTEPDLDMHYWQECPMLTQCPACQQVIEISGLFDHLLVECEHQAKFRRCERCGEVVAAAELEAHTKANSCTPAVAPDVANRCPLCHKDIDPEPEGWLKHLLDEGCPDNPRKRLS